jgi:Na+/H+ antiporter NhaD/arsenite permease-like protein
MLLAVAARIALAAAGQQLPLRTIATAAGAPVLLGLRGRPRLLTGIDWHTLIFFAALFVLVQAVWDTGALQNRLPADPAWLIAPAPLLAASCLGSQLVSNVPLVALALPLIEQAGGTAESLLALAAGSTIAGNLTLIGAASNIIILQAAERRGERLGFWRFAAIGAPLTLLNLAVYNWLL